MRACQVCLAAKRLVAARTGCLKCFHFSRGTSAMHRRNFIKAGAALTMLNRFGAVSGQQVPSRTWGDYDFGSGPVPADRLNQGPFGIEQDEGWYTVLVTSQSDQPVRNYGLGLVGYSWEEGGPSLAARKGAETLEKHVENLS